MIADAFVFWLNTPAVHYVYENKMFSSVVREKRWSATRHEFALQNAFSTE